MKCRNPFFQLICTRSRLKTPPVLSCTCRNRRTSPMAPRFTEAEKGKHQMRNKQENGIKRIKAPSLDNSALIKDNALTLIGRLTNPQDQKIWALIPALPRKWNLLGRETGSGLGNNCFQFRFEREDDLRRVLDNGPYHFAYWMVILQRWGPVISNSSPPFDSILNQNKRASTSLLAWRYCVSCWPRTARVRVLVDGLKPLIKESIVKFDSGEESLITLEYEKLESHSSICASLLHARRNCPRKQGSESSRHLLSTSNSGDGFHKNRINKSFKRKHYSAGSKYWIDKQKSHTFMERVNRHGNPFGERVSTKRTWVPPPVNASRAHNSSEQTWRHNNTHGESKKYSTPQYTKNRQAASRAP